MATFSSYIYSRLVDYEYIINNTMIDKNVDSQYIVQAIDKAQNKFIQGALGYNLYQSLMGMVADNSIYNPSNSNYLFLLMNFVIPCLKEWVVYEILPYLNFHLTNKNVGTKDSDNGNPTDKDTIAWLRQIAKNDGEFWIQRIYQYIINNTGFFPEYWTTNQIGSITPKALNYDDCMYFSSGTLLNIGSMDITSDKISGTPPAWGGYFGV